MNKTVSKIFLAIGLVVGLAPAVMADDIGTAFIPTGQSPIKMKGSVHGDEMKCKDSNKQDCQKVFNEVFDILNGSAKINHSNVIDGYIKFKGKKRKNVQFTSVVEKHNGSVARMICEIDQENDNFGLRWVDPSAR